MVAAPTRRRSRRLSRQRRRQRLLRLPSREGSDSGPWEKQSPESQEGSSARPLPITSEPEREALVDEAIALFGSKYGRTLSRDEAGRTMYRLTAFYGLLVEMGSPEELPMRMLFQPLGDGTFHRACEADSFRALVAAFLDDPNYERADVETRLVARLRIADDVRLLGQMQGRIVAIGDRDGENVVNVASDEPFIRSLDRLGVVSLAPNFAGEASG